MSTMWVAAKSGDSGPWVFSVWVLVRIEGLHGGYDNYRNQTLCNLQVEMFVNRRGELKAPRGNGTGRTKDARTSFRGRRNRDKHERRFRPRSQKQKRVDGR